MNLRPLSALLALTIAIPNCTSFAQQAASPVQRDAAASNSVSDATSTPTVTPFAFGNGVSPTFYGSWCKFPYPALSVPKGETLVLQQAFWTEPAVQEGGTFYLTVTATTNKLRVEHWVATTFQPGQGTASPNAKVTQSIPLSLYADGDTAVVVTLYYIGGACPGNGPLPEGLVQNNYSLSGYLTSQL
jgi:hypothetical protein